MAVKVGKIHETQVSTDLPHGGDHLLRALQHPGDGHTAEAQSLSGFSFWFSFRWPSVVYALDILAWDWFFGLSMLFLAPVFWRRRPLSELLVLSGVLSLAGLLGVALENMPIRNIGILGCAVAAPVASLRI